jgi:hypothetical protein
MTGKSTPLARGVRQFLIALAGTGILVSLTHVSLFSDLRTTAEEVGLALLVSALSGLAAFLIAWSGYTADTPIGRALTTTLYLFGSGLATVGIVALTPADLRDTGQAIVDLLGQSVAAGVLSFVTNAAEDSNAGPKSRRRTA